MVPANVNAERGIVDPVALAIAAADGPTLDRSEARLGGSSVRNLNSDSEMIAGTLASMMSATVSATGRSSGDTTPTNPSVHANSRGHYDRTLAALLDAEACRVDHAVLLVVAGRHEGRDELVASCSPLRRQLVGTRAAIVK